MRRIIIAFRRRSFQWGQRVVSELHLRGDECVLDAGCGTGKLTRLLLQSLPRGRVVGLDLSLNMAQHAQQNLKPDFGQCAGFVTADFLALPFSNCFDGIFSTASFHWVRDHDLLFRSLHAALRPSGWLHAQCGGGPNIALLRKRVSDLAREPEFAKWICDFPEPWFFSDAESALQRLRAAGFENVETGLEQANYSASSGEEFQEYLRTFVLHRHLELFPNEELRASFLRRLAELAGADDPPWTLDYCRLNIRARKGSGTS